MRKVVLFLSGLTAIALSCPLLHVDFSPVNAADAIYLGSRVERGTAESAIVQPAESVLRGDSTLRFGLELSGGEKNKFLRMANFDGAPGSLQTAVSFRTEVTPCTAAEVRFSYRLFEGETAYSADAPVLSFSFRGAEKQFSYRELTPATETDLGMRELTFGIEGLQGTSSRFTVTFHYASSLSYSESGAYADIGNLSVKSGGKELVLDGKMSSGAVTERDEQVYAKPERGDTSLMLFGSDAVDYEENTLFDGVLRQNFNCGTRSAPLAPQGSDGTFRGAASVSAGESDIFAVYDPYEQNTFLRLANKNGAAGVTQTRFYTYFYDNETGATGNLPLCEQIFFSFRYRLFMDDYVRAGLTGREPILHLSTRSSAANHAGEISLDELVVNEAGDESWHTYSSVLDVRRSSTAYMIITYYSHAGTEFSDTTFLDFDSLTLSANKGGKNYAHLNGEFEGLADGNPESEVFFRRELGDPAEKIALSSLDHAMSAAHGQTFSLHLKLPRKTNVWYATFDVAGERGAKFTLLFNGRNGDVLPLTVGENSTKAPLGVHWTEESGSWRCRLYYAREAYSLVSSLDFVNSGNETLIFDDLIVGQVRSVCKQAGDFSTYNAHLQELKERINGDETLNIASDLLLAQLLVRAEKITQYSSAERMDECLSALETALSGAGHVANMTALNTAIEAADRLLTEHDAEVYTKTTRLQFLDALAKARRVTAEDGQSAADEAARALTEAMDALVFAEESQSDKTALVAVSVTGGTLGAGVLVGAILLKRRHGI